MSATETKSVTLTKMCELHGIALPRNADIAGRFSEAFPTAHFDEKVGEWRMAWKKGSFAESNVRLEAFFTENGVAVFHVDKC